MLALLCVPWAIDAQTVYLDHDFSSEVPTSTIDYPDATVRWSEYSTPASDVFSGEDMTLEANGGWTYASSGRSGLPAGHYFRQLTTRGIYSWLVTPSITIPSGAVFQLSFDLALTSPNSATAADLSGTKGDDKKFMVIVSTDNGATWSESNATKWLKTGGNYDLASLNATYQHFVLDMSSYSGNTIKIAFYCESTATQMQGGRMEFHIDNVKVSTPPSCQQLSSLIVSGITTNGATLEWNDNYNTGATYTVFRDDAEGRLQVATGLTTTEYPITGLNANTEYNYYVRVDCAGQDGSSDMSGVSFTTLCLPVTNVSYSNLSANGVTLTWEDNENRQYGYKVMNGNVVLEEVYDGTT